MSRRGLGRGGKRPRYRRYVKAKRVGGRQYIPRTLGPLAVSESKYFDAENGGFAVAEESQSWAAASDVFKGVMAIPQQGNSATTRVGRRIEVYKIAVRGVIQTTIAADAGDVQVPSFYRCMLWMDQQTNGTVTTSAALMQPSTANTIPMVACAFQNIANFGRFRVLKDFSLLPGQQETGTDGASTMSIGQSDVPFKCTYKFKKPLRIKFAANGGNIGDVVDNSIYFSMNKASGSGTQTVTVRSRVYFKDI